MDVLRQWQFRGLLDHVKWDGCLIRQKQHSCGRRFYSVLDLLKLSAMAELVELGMRVEVAAQAPALIEVMVLAGEDRDALERGKLPECPLLFAKTSGDELELAYFVSRSGAQSPWASAEIALSEGPVCAGILIDWPGLVGRVFEDLKLIDRLMGRS